MKRFTIQKATAGISKHIVKNSRTYLMGSLIAAFVVFIIALIAYAVASRSIFAITIDNTAVCYLKTESQAEHVMDMVIEHFTPEGSEVKAVSTNDRISIVKKAKKVAKTSDLLKVEDAYAVLLAAIEKDKTIDIIIASTRADIKDYIPEPIYVFDKKMIAGDTKVVEEGKAGKQEITTTYVSHNGKITSKKKTATKILDDGKKATVKKGNIGLPEGKDWKTFKGTPIFKDGKDLAKAGLAHLGAPYKYGGYSFTTGIDCVQLVRSLYKKYGINLPNNHSGIQHTGKGVSLKKAQKGDIVCYKHHMGIYIGNGKMVNAVKGGVKVSPVKTEKLVTIRRVVK